MRMGEIAGLAAAVLSSALGGTSVAATRYLTGALDPLAIGAFRFGIGFALLLPVAIARREAWPAGRDRAVCAGLGLLFFLLFPILFNASLGRTTAARGALALSTLPLLTLATAAVLRVEALTARKLAGVLLATAGVAMALAANLDDAPPGAWIGDLLMVAAAFCMALYGIWSKPIIARSGALTFTVAAMGIGAAALILLGLAQGSFAAAADFDAAQWVAASYLGAAGAALTFFLWAYALGRTTPTRVAVSVTVNPIAASLTAAVLLDEPLGWSLVLGIAAVAAGIGIAMTRARQSR
jgi:drug/metabolite transporter (DMT)-like permease